jgi:hypothetical protein
MKIEARFSKLLFHFLTILFMDVVVLVICFSDNILIDLKDQILWGRVVAVGFLCVVFTAMTYHLFRMLFHREAILILENGVIIDYTYLFKFPRKIKVEEIRSINPYPAYRGIESYKLRLAKKDIYLTALYFKGKMLDQFIDKVKEEIEVHTQLQK